MRTLVLFAISLFLPIAAFCAPASEASIDELLVLTKTETMLDAAYTLVENQIRRAIQQSTAGQTLTPAQQQVLDELPAKFMGTMKSEITWDIVRPAIVQVYRDNYDQAEIDGMVAFFKTPAGQAYATRAPLVAQGMNAAMQTRLQTVIPKMQAALRSALAEAQIR